MALFRLILCLVDQTGGKPSGNTQCGLLKQMAFYFVTHPHDAVWLDVCSVYLFYRLIGATSENLRQVFSFDSAAVWCFPIDKAAVERKELRP